MESQKIKDKSDTRRTELGIKGLKDALEKLKSKKTHHVNNALIWLRQVHIKKCDGPRTFCEGGGLEKLNYILRGTNKKWLDISLSILGNLVTEEKARQQVLRLNGIWPIVQILKTIEDESVQNRACRTLANLAQNQNCAKVILNEGNIEVEEEGDKKKGKKKTSQSAAVKQSTSKSGSQNSEPSLVQCVVDLLENTENIDCQLTYLRALRLFGDSESYHDSVIECQGVRIISTLMTSSKIPVVQASLKSVAHFLHRTKAEPAVWQFVNAKGPEALLSLAQHKNQDISRISSSLLLAFVKHELLRPCLGNAGVIQYLIEQIQKESKIAPKETFPVISALCLFCGEVVNRAKIRCAGGLELFLRLLKDEDYFVLHYKLVSALVFFLYDDAGMEVLLRNGLIEILLNIFVQCAQIQTISLHTVFLNHVLGSYVPNESSSKRHIFEHISEKEHSETDEIGTDLISNLTEIPQQSSTSNEKTPDKIKMIDEAEQLDNCGFNNDTNDKVNEAHIIEEGEIKHGQNKQNEETTLDSKKKGHKYSMNSPTYQSLSSWTFEEENGPLNIFDAKRSTGACSPDELYPYHSPPYMSPYTPMTTSPYHSPSWSFTSSPGRSVSPHFSDMSCPSSRESSPTRSLSPCGWQSSANAATNFSLLRGDGNLSSTIHRSLSDSELSEIGHKSWPGSSPNESRSSSPFFLPNSPRRSSADNQGNPTDLWWSPVPSKALQQNLQFSDEEDVTFSTASSDTSGSRPSRKRKRSGNNSESQEALNKAGSFEYDLLLSKDTKVLPQSQESSYSSPLHSDPAYAQGMSTDFGIALSGESLVMRQISSDSTPGPVLAVREGNASPLPKAKEETDFKPVAAVSRDKSNELNQASKMNVEKRRKTVSDNESVASEKTINKCSASKGKTVAKSPKNMMNKGKIQQKQEEKSKPLSPAKTTEDSILVILSKLSYAEEPSSQLLSRNVIETLLIYLLCSKRPFLRAERILRRLVTNAKCIPAILGLHAPVKIHLSSVCHAVPFNKPVNTVSVSGKKEDIAKLINPDQALSSSSSKIIQDKDAKINENQASETSKSRETSMEKDKSITQVGDAKEVNVETPRKNNPYTNTRLSVDEREQKTNDDVEEQEDLTNGEDSKKFRINTRCVEALQELVAQMSILMTSEYGRGVLQHGLMSGSEAEKQACALAVPICCRDDDFLKTCMIKHGGLSILGEILKDADSDDGMLMLACHALHRLAVRGDMMLIQYGVGMHPRQEIFKQQKNQKPNTFGFINASKSRYSHKHDEGNIGENRKISQLCCKINPPTDFSSCLPRAKSAPVICNMKTDILAENLVVFEVEDKQVKADRKLMCQFSQVFAAMLEGHYAEKSQSCIKLRDTSFTAFTILCDVIHNDVSSLELLLTSHCKFQVKDGRQEKQSRHEITNARTSSILQHSKDKIATFPIQSRDTSSDVIRKPLRLETHHKLNSDTKQVHSRSFKNSKLQSAYALNADVGEATEIIDVYLEVLALADRFMLCDVVHDLSLAIFDRAVGFDNVVKVMEFAVCHHCQLLASRCAALLTSHCVSMATRITWYKQLRHCTHSCDVIDRICDVIVEHLPLKLKICKLSSR